MSYVPAPGIILVTFFWLLFSFWVSLAYLGAQTGFQMWPHKCQVEENNFPSPAGYAFVAWYVVSCHYLKGAVLILVQLFNWDPRVPFCRAATSLASPQPRPLHGIFSSWVQDFVLSTYSSHIQGSRQPWPPAHQPATSPVSRRACAKGAFQLIIQITEYIKQHKPQYCSLRCTTHN